MQLGITGRTALVTGAASGIGREIGRTLSAEGARVVMTDRDAGGLEESQKHIGSEMPAFAADLSNIDELARLHEQVQAQAGDIDILVNSAGITGAQGLFHEIDDSGWVEAIDVNLLGAVRLTREFLPDLRRGGWGRIVYLASEDASQPYDDELPYSAAKAGVLAFAKGLSRTYAKEGIRVNCVSPAFINTSMTDAMMEKRAESLSMSFDEAISTFIDSERPFMSIHRRGKPSEAASVTAFLCSERAEFVNGSNYRVDAGSVGTV